MRRDIRICMEPDPPVITISFFFTRQPSWQISFFGFEHSFFANSPMSFFPRFLILVKMIYTYTQTPFFGSSSFGTKPNEIIGPYSVQNETFAWIPPIDPWSRFLIMFFFQDYKEKQPEISCPKRLSKFIQVISSWKLYWNYIPVLDLWQNRAQVIAKSR